MPLIKDGKLHKKRIKDDLIPLLKIRGPKFDIPYKDKKKLLLISQEDIKWLWENCGIDYTNVKIPQEYKLDLEFTEEVIEDIKKAYFQLSKTIKSLVIEYLQKQLTSSSSDKSKSYLKGLVHELGIINNDIVFNKAEKVLRKNLGIKENIEVADIYKEIALFMERHGQMVSAQLLMGMALELRPNGTFIQKKCNEYNELLKSK